MRFEVWGALLGGLACVACTQGMKTSSEIDHERDVVRYEFEADTLKAALENALNSSTAREGDATFMGYTWSDWEWRIKWREADGYCRLTDVTFDIDTTVTLPEWVDVDRASVQARQEWQRFMTALEGHEEGHVEINIKGVTDMKTAMLAMEKASTCDDLLAGAREISSDYGEQIKQAHLDYDRDTQHGATQGARLLVD